MLVDKLERGWIEAEVREVRETNFIVVMQGNEQWFEEHGFEDEGKGWRRWPPRVEHVDTFRENKVQPSCGRGLSGDVADGADVQVLQNGMWSHADLVERRQPDSQREPYTTAEVFDVLPLRATRWRVPPRRRHVCLYPAPLLTSLRSQWHPFPHLPALTSPSPPHTLDSKPTTGVSTARATRSPCARKGSVLPPAALYVG